MPDTGNIRAIGLRSSVAHPVALDGEVQEAQELDILRRPARTNESLRARTVEVPLRPIVERDRDRAYNALRRPTSREDLRINTYDTDFGRFAVKSTDWGRLVKRALIWTAGKKQ